MWKYWKNPREKERTENFIFVMNDVLVVVVCCKHLFFKIVYLNSNLPFPPPTTTENVLLLLSAPSFILLWAKDKKKSLKMKFILRIL